MNARRGSIFSASFLRKKNIGRFILAVLVFLVLRSYFQSRQRTKEIKHHNVLERVTRPDKTLDVQRHDFLQVRIGGALQRDMMDDLISDGMFTVSRKEGRKCVCSGADYCHG